MPELRFRSRQALAFMSFTTLTFGLGLINHVPTAHAATMGSRTLLHKAAGSTVYPMVRKEIDMDGQSLSSPYGFVAGGTTYLPIWYVMQALKQLHTQSLWDGHNWSLITPGSLSTIGPQGNGSVSVYVNGTLVYRVNRIANVDPSSGHQTTFIPVYAIMQILKALGISNTWDGTHWTIQNSPSASPSPNSGLGSGSSSTNSSQNGATKDESYWQRAGTDLYIDTFTADPVTSQKSGPRILDLQPGQTLTMYAYSNTRNLDAPEWFVNSQDATITPIHQGTSLSSQGNPYTSSNSMVSFVARKPGIYTVQAQTSDGDYSVPMVLIVGLSQLQGSPIPVPTGQDGVLPLPSNLAQVATAQGSSVTYQPFEPVNGWLPISGKFNTPGPTSVVVDLSTSGFAQEYNYELPVRPDGTFSGMVRMPFGGDVRVSFVLNMYQQLTTTQSWQADSFYVVSSPAINMPEQQQSLLASAMMDYNMSSVFNQEASVLMTNSPSMDTGIAAIANFVSEKINYDWVDYQNNRSIWQDNTTTWQTNSGVCQDIAETTASMLKSIGIPAETVIGSAPKNDNSNDHEWLRIWNGSAWRLMDPTWNLPGVQGATVNVNDHLDNEYMGNTLSMQTTHFPQSGMTGTWQ